MVDWLIETPFILTFLGLGIVFGCSLAVASFVNKREAERAPRITEAEANSFWESIEKAALPVAKATVLGSD